MNLLASLRHLYPQIRGIPLSSLKVLETCEASASHSLFAKLAIHASTVDGRLPSSGPYLLSGASGMHLWEGLGGSEPEYIPLPHRYGRYVCLCVTQDSYPQNNPHNRTQATAPHQKDKSLHTFTAHEFDKNMIVDLTFAAWASAINPTTVLCADTAGRKNTTSAPLCKTCSVFGHAIKSRECPADPDNIEAEQIIQEWQQIALTKAESL
ncbi:hypothetical protein J3Q64DRAFT_1842505 [Phycomyces blakesleeanus]|uniref:Uncharacterized protein n=1 Tax=Phycomyces blakesleeanus TaxID=4837 RepID=A0ABR3AGD4_PHYBL